MHPISYSKGIDEIGKVIKKTKFILIISMLRRFSTIYPDLISQPLMNYFEEIKKFKNLGLNKLPEIICELEERLWLKAVQLL